MKAIRRGIADGLTDVLPQSQSHDEQLIRMWREGMDTGQLSLEFRLRRAIRVIPISNQSIDGALAAFDGVVRRVEEDIVKETIGGNILEAWFPNCQDEGTCVACDFRYFCPRPAGTDPDHQVACPTAP